MIKASIDKYYKWPLIIDFIVVVCVWIFSGCLKIISFTYADQPNSLNLISSLIGSMISLAGFTLAALTIIVTFKSSLIAKGVNEATNALELLFSSRHYKSIVKVFKDSIMEFLIYSLLGYCAWQSYANLTPALLSKVVITLILVATLNISRSLFMLFSILSLNVK